MPCIDQGLGRGGEIRTHDHLHPMQVRYQAALRPGKRYKLYQSKVIENLAKGIRRAGYRVLAEFRAAWSRQIRSSLIGLRLQTGRDGRVRH